jgi:MFS family permease
MKREQLWGWIQVVLAAAAMVMTIPSRTQGLALVSELQLADPLLALERIDYAFLNMVATLAGAAFALPIGWLIDRFRIRWVLILNLLFLGFASWMFSQTEGRIHFLVGLILMRGLGQSGLSTSSLTLVGKWFPQRLPQAMAVFGIISTIGFMTIFGVVDAMVKAEGWRTTWHYLGTGLLILAGVSVLICRNPNVPSVSISSNSSQRTSYRWGEALRSPTFWLFAIACALFNLVSSGIGLFNEDVLKESGFTKDHMLQGMIIATLMTLLTNGVAGWLSNRWSLAKLMAAGMLMLGVCLLILPFMTEVWHVYANAVFLGGSAGVVIVVFFACWGSLFGPDHLGKIQGTAQVLTVLSSAVGPLLLAWCKAQYASYRPFYYALAGLAAVLAVMLWTHRSTLLKQGDRQM